MRKVIPMNLTSFSLLLFSLLLFSITNSIAQKDSLNTKSFQIIIRYFDKTGDVIYEIPRVKDSTSNNFKNAYSIFTEEAEGGPYLLYFLHGNFEFYNTQGDKLCFSFEIYSSTSFRKDYPIDEYSKISSSLGNCNEQTQLREYNYFLKEHLLDIFKYKSRVLLIIDKKRELSLELKIKD